MRTPAITSPRLAGQRGWYDVTARWNTSAAGPRMARDARLYLALPLVHDARDGIGGAGPLHDRHLSGHARLESRRRHQSRSLRVQRTAPFAVARGHGLPR